MIHSISKSVGSLGSIVVALGLGACASSSSTPAESPADETPATAESSAEPEAAPLAEPVESEEQYFVEGVAGGAMIRTVELEAEVVSVDQEKREAVVRGPEGNEVVIKVGKDARNFYQVAAGDRVKVAMARELVIYVEEEGEEDETPDGTAVAGGRAQEGDAPAGVVVETTKVTATIKSMDTAARTATLSLDTGEEQVFEVRPDVDMSKYKVGQKVVFLITDMLALKVEKI